MDHRHDSGTLLITGATGLVGGALARTTRASGRPVRALVRTRARATALEALGVDLVEGALDDATALAESVRGVDAVVHCAARAADTGALADFVRDNVEGSLALYRAARDAWVRRFVFLSTISVYGFAPPARVDEDTPLPRIAGYPYAESKIAAEGALVEEARAGGPELVIARVGSVYGPGSYHWTERPVRLLKGPTGMLLVDGGAGLHNFIYTDNLIDALVACADVDAAAGQTFNLVGGTVTYQAFWKRYADMLGRGRFRTLSKTSALLLAGVVEAVARLRGKDPLITRIAVRLLCRRATISSEKARKVLGWVPRVRLYEGMAASERWLRDAGIL